MAAAIRSEILIQAKSAHLLGATFKEADDLLLNLHYITTPADADFTITAQASLETAASTMARTLTVLLGGIAAISLLVGGIGVMHIMLVSVTERVREIGLRRALGATPGAIRRQFLTESALLGLGGGIFGVLAGILGAMPLPHLLGEPIQLSAPAMAGASLLPPASAWSLASIRPPVPPDWPPLTPFAPSNRQASRPRLIRETAIGLGVFGG